METFTGWRWNEAEWKRLELAKSGHSAADVSVNAASGDSAAGEASWAVSGMAGYAGSSSQRNSSLERV